MDIDGLIAEVTEIAEDVYRELGVGHVEAPYQKAMEVGLRLRGIRFEAQKVIEITYRDHYVGDCNLDLLIDKRLVVELKAAGQAAGPDHDQLAKYLRLLRLSHGLLVNFTKPGRSKKQKHAAGPEITPVRLL